MGATEDAAARRAVAGRAPLWSAGEVTKLSYHDSEVDGEETGGRAAEDVRGGEPSAPSSSRRYGSYWSVEKVV
jgi:hypothetical protein